jgi:hypothetical protein
MSMPADTNKTWRTWEGFEICRSRSNTSQGIIVGFRRWKIAGLLIWHCSSELGKVDWGRKAGNFGRIVASEGLKEGEDSNFDNFARLFSVFLDTLEKNSTRLL